MGLHVLDNSILIAYLLAIFLVGFLRKSSNQQSDYVLMGRRLTLPAFVMTLVSTWYGGILGVSEYSTSYGISNWVIFGLPYYFFGIIFALLVAKRAHARNIASIPELMHQTYGLQSSRLASLWVLLLASPAPYILTLGFLLNYYSGLPLTVSIVVGAVFSFAYIMRGGLASVVNTDKIQFILMFLGFFIILITLALTYKSPLEMWQSLPPTHRSLTGGHSFGYILVWFIIGSWTLVDPGFHQRVYAAESSRTARHGILIAIGFWFLFDLMTTFTGLYAYSYLAPGYEPSQAFLVLGQQVLPIGLQGLFLIGILATVMSTLDSTTLVSGITLGSDLLSGTTIAKRYASGFLIKVGMAIILLVGVLMAISIPSVIGLWYLFGTIAIPALLLPTMTALIHRPMHPGSVRANLIFSPSIAMVWFFFGKVDAGGTYFFGLEPFYPGIICSVLIFICQYYCRKEHNA